LAERLANANDRRIIMVSVTDNGRRRLERCKMQIGENLGRKLAALSRQELDDLSLALTKLVEIGSRLE
jgi:DNA-binding MarR family transcriptional regulator